ncbi:putative Clusterin associated protein 1 [Giardia duodenalis assemblage B]|uniref:Putative Clusterin associated protein 1 n=1 Tax=Giardia duodenalis assemblage B TaxID=1394984 RepID=A0A132NYQ5_GIAIN|nr:putative Clusterin associated protein 1 [Giardia intestinalis assemblage B]
MSYYELQSFTLLMTQIGFPRPISIDTFRKPDFFLVAEILHYIITIVAPNNAIAMDIGTQEDRVYFITTVVGVLQSTLHLKLDPKKIYAAGPEAVRELRKIVQEVATYIGATAVSADKGSYSAASVDLTLHSNALRVASSKIVEASTKLLTQLRLHVDDLYQRMQQAMSSQPDALSLSGAVQQRIKNLASECSALQEEVTTNKREKAKLEEQMNQKKQSITHTMDRLDAIRSTKPPFLAELEAMEAELSKLHLEYARKFRSLLFLEGQLRANDVREQQRMIEREKNLRTLQENALKEELNNMYGGVDAHSSSSHLDDEFVETPMPHVMDMHQPKPAQDFVPPRAAPINTNTEIPDDESYSYSYEDEEEEERAANSTNPTRQMHTSEAHFNEEKRREIGEPSNRKSNENADEEEYSYEYSDIGGEELDPDNIEF